MLRAERCGGPWAVLFAGFAALSLVACTGYDFQTRGVYEAPASHLRFEVVGGGRVNSGQDVADRGTGFALFCPTHGVSAAPVLVTLSGAPGFVNWEVQSPKPMRAKMTWNAASLEDRLRVAGHARLDAAELAESVNTVGSALGGPKGIVLRGQSTRLNVISARFSRKRATTPATPSGCSSI